MWNPFKKPTEPAKPVAVEPVAQSPFSTHKSRINHQAYIEANAFQKTAADFVQVNTGMDSIAGTGMDSSTIKSAYNLSNGVANRAVLSWYVSQTFVGYQNCALIAQNWLVGKACAMPARDAIKRGYDVTANDGEDIKPEDLVKLRATDKAYKVDSNLVELETFRRIFGVRVVLFKFKNATDKFYEEPFNIDSVKPGSYLGMTQVDPMWMAPILDEDAVAKPDSMEFYEPTYWQIGSTKYHKSHLVVVRYGTLPDVLKPSYQYGGIPLTQLIYERAYAAERTANEGPLLAMTKRMQGLQTDITSAIGDPDSFYKRMVSNVENRDNHGLLMIDTDEKYFQMETALADLDLTIMTQYQLVSAIAGVPATKLIETSPKGFSSTGEFEQESYHDSLAAIQVDVMTPLLDRHYQLVMKSDFESDEVVSVVWKPLKAPTDKEIAEINLLKAQAAQAYTIAGVTDAEDERARIIADENSGYNGLEPFEDLDPDEDDVTGHSGGESIQEVSLNGAQITAVLAIVNQVSTGILPRENAISMITSSFPLSAEQAAEMVPPESTIDPLEMEAASGEEKARF